MAHSSTDQWIAIGLISSILGGVFTLVPRLRYVVDQDYLRVVLGGVTLRKIALADIEFIDTQAPIWNEHWCNCFVPKGRIVRIRRKTGLVRNFIITPKDRELFMKELKQRGVEAIVPSA